MGHRARPQRRRRSARRGAAAALAVLTAAVGGVPGVAAAYDTRDVAGWTVAPSADGEGCFISRAYDRRGGTTLLLGLDASGANHLSVLNDHWSIKPREKLKLTFRLSRGGYTDQPAIGIESEGKRGFVTTFEPKFPGFFAASRGLHILRGEVPVERLTLDGSGAAVAELRRCVAVAGTTRTRNRGQDRDGSIPRDPFAKKRRGGE